MTNKIHRVYILSLTIITIAAFISLAVFGGDYYFTSLAERHVHEQYSFLKPTGLVGHGLGMAGSLLIITGVFGYMARKRIKLFSGIGVLKYWLEFHIFLCILGPVLILYHTTFKFGGVVAISFWSMVAVIISGIIGRFIYLQIPQTIHGRLLSLEELRQQESNLFSEIKNTAASDINLLMSLENDLSRNESNDRDSVILIISKRLSYERKLIKRIKKQLVSAKLTKKQYKKIIRLIKTRIKLSRRISWMTSMQGLLKYWHVAHLPLALVMLIIMVIHVFVAVILGYTWIF